MDARIVEFSEVLRQNGVRVSTAEVQDACRATAEVHLADRALFKAALKATLVKRQQDAETFERAFGFYFSGAAKTFEAIDKALLDRIQEAGLLQGDELKMLVIQMQNLLPSLSPLAQAALTGDRARLAQLFRAASLQLDMSGMESALQVGFFSRRLLSGAGMEKAREDVKALEGELTRRGLSPEGVEIVSRHVGEALRKVEEAARKEVQREVKARLKGPSASWQSRPVSQLTRSELEQMQTAVRRLAERLKTRLVRRQRSTRRGALYVRRTLRRNLPWGGIPMVPVFRRRRPERPEVVVLCDVSDSVRNTSRMMLLFTYTLQSLFVRVRSFVFVSDVGEVTDLFKGADVDQALEQALSGRAVSLTANSNYGRALASFVRDHLGSISRRTTVMVIGDGRNNFNASNAWALKDLKRKARRVVWICPEDKRSWGFGDSEMLTYAREVTHAVTVQSLEDLERIADKLVPT